MTALIVLGVLAAIVGFAIVLYNQLVRLRNASEGAWSDVDVQLKRRYELIPNLIETVKGYAAHEKSAFDAVTKARSQAMQATTPEGKSAAEGGLSASLKSLFAVAEAYPELKANQNFLSLQAELAKLEDAIQNARRYYNAIVRDLNTQCEAFPSNLVASTFGFAKKQYFELDSAAERTAPRVQFGS
jgi:LemA protein